MTTIAYRDGVLAADTLATWCGGRSGYATKVVKRGPMLAAASGAATACGRFLDWFKSGMPDMPDMGDGQKEGYWATGIIVMPDDMIVEFSPDGVSRKRAEMYAVGSGADYALGAMAAGATAEGAVQAAIRFDTKSGGEITVLRR